MSLINIKGDADFRIRRNFEKSLVKPIDVTGILNRSTNVQVCEIRESCRWFKNRGFHACARCNTIIRAMEANWAELEINLT